MLIEHKGQHFCMVVGSDVTRDGMFIELSEAGSVPVLMEAFYSDADGSFTITGFGSPVPIEVAEQFIARARESLPPQRPAHR